MSNFFHFEICDKIFAKKNLKKKTNETFVKFVHVGYTTEGESQNRTPGSEVKLDAVPQPSYFLDNPYIFDYGG